MKLAALGIRADHGELGGRFGGDGVGRPHADRQHTQGLGQVGHAAVDADQGAGAGDDARLHGQDLGGTDFLLDPVDAWSRFDRSHGPPVGVDQGVDQEHRDLFSEPPDEPRHQVPVGGRVGQFLAECEVHRHIVGGQRSQALLRGADVGVDGLQAGVAVDETVAGQPDPAPLEQLEQHLGVQAVIALGAHQLRRLVVDFLLDLAGGQRHLVGVGLPQRVVAVLLAFVGNQVEHIQVAAADAGVPAPDPAPGDDDQAGLVDPVVLAEPPQHGDPVEDLVSDAAHPWAQQDRAAAATGGGDDVLDPAEPGHLGGIQLFGHQVAEQDAALGQHGQEHRVEAGKDPAGVDVLQRPAGAHQKADDEAATHVGAQPVLHEPLGLADAQDQLDDDAQAPGRGPGSGRERQGPHDRLGRRVRGFLGRLDRQGDGAGDRVE